MRQRNKSKVKHDHRLTEYFEMEGTTWIINSSSSLNGALGDQTYNLGIISTILWPTELISGNINNSSCFENKDSKVAVLSSWYLHSYFSSTEENALGIISV